MSKVVVQKYGGSSVSNTDKIKLIASKLVERKKKNPKIVVVVSAMGDTTDDFINMAKDISKSPDKRELDALMSTGEMISASLLSMSLNSMGCEAVSYNAYQLNIQTSGLHGKSLIDDIDVSKIEDSLDNGKIVIVTGFQGLNDEGDITTLGRGGSDTSAVALAVKLNGVCEIYTDVDGIMTADPRIEPDAKVLKYVDYDEVFQMAENGAKVIHPRAVELAKNADIILQIKNTYNQTFEGTKIGPASMLKDAYEDSSKTKFMSAVAHRDKIAQVKVIGSEEDFSDILNEMEDRHINMDMINFLTEKKAFALDVSNLDEVENILKQHDVEYEIKPDCAKVTLIGNKVTETPGVIAKIMRALNAENITLLQSSDSYNSLSCLVDEKDMVTTVHVIHNAFSA